MRIHNYTDFSDHSINVYVLNHVAQLRFISIQVLTVSI